MDKKQFGILIGLLIWIGVILTLFFIGFLNNLPYWVK